MYVIDSKGDQLDTTIIIQAVVNGPQWRTEK